MDRLSGWLNRLSLYIALLTAWVAMLGSLYFSEVKGYLPCDLCWYQRILMYPLTVLLAFGITVRDKWIPRLVLPFSTLGIFVSTYHYLLEKTDLFGESTFCRAGVSCTTVWINWFGFVTIPFLALTAFMIITLMCIVAILAGEPKSAEADARYDAGDDTLIASQAVAAGGDGNEESIALLEEDADEFDKPWPRRPGLLVALLVGAVLVVFGVLFSNGWTERAEAQALVASMDAIVPSTLTGDMSTADDTAVTGTITRTVASSEPEAIAQGHALFALNCATCHGPNGEGVTGLGNTLSANTFIGGQDDVALLAFIHEGREITHPDNTTGMVMPPSGGNPNLTDTQLQAIIDYLRSLQ